MYESPINRICSEITHQVSIDEENKAMLEVRKVLGYDIDKDELIKALRYDRNQYEKGFRDGLEYKAAWIPVIEKLPEEPYMYLVSIINRFGYPQMEVDRFIDGKWERFGTDVIAWMPLPDPYVAESEE